MNLGWPAWGVWLGLSLISLGIPGCTPVETPPPAEEATVDQPDQEAWGWSTRVTRLGRKRAEIKAAHFQKFDLSRKAELDGGVEVLFYDRTGEKQVSKLTSERAQMDEETSNMLVFGKVILVSTDSTRLETDSLAWERETDKITGNGTVTLWRPDGVETGVGFEASSDLKRWSMHQVITRLGSPDSLQ